MRLGSFWSLGGVRGWGNIITEGGKMKSIKIKDIKIDDSKTLDYFYIELSKLEESIKTEIGSIRKEIKENYFGHVRESTLKLIDLIEIKNSALPPIIAEMNTAFQRTIKVEEWKWLLIQQV